MTGERDRVFRALHDMRGSIIALVDAESGEIVQETEYSAFGEVVAHTGVAEGTYHPFGFAGGLYDPSTGLTRFGARDYDAYVGRWLDRDPILWDGGLWNLYDYVGGDPINWVDPSGLAPECEDKQERANENGDLERDPCTAVRVATCNMSCARDFDRERRRCARYNYTPLYPICEHEAFLDYETCSADCALCGEDNN